jgi:3-methyladenine DNA glycosylase AlkD
MPELSPFSQALVTACELQKDAERAEKMAAYMKGKFAYFGIMAKPRNEILKAIIKEKTLPNDVIAIAKELWRQPQRELHYCAIELMLKGKKQWTENTIAELEWFIITHSWWDSVDSIAVSLVGEYFKKWPDQKEAITQKWNASENLWLVRTSILFQLKYKRNTDLEMLARYCLAHAHQKEFFIKKAIGWVLREYAKTDKNWVLSFVESYHFQSLSVKEALKHIK